MNQTQKRLSIIKLAISIGDTETIQLQILKLAPLKNDEKIQEIIRGLQAENYAQTQALITSYIETPPEEIHQRTMNHEPLTPEEEEEIIEEFDLFRVGPEKKEDGIKEILDLEKMVDTPKSIKPPNDINYDALLNLTSEDVLADNISIEQSTLSEDDDFFDVDSREERYDYTEVIEKDDFFHDLQDNEISERKEEAEHTVTRSHESDQKEHKSVSETRFSHMSDDKPMTDTPQTEPHTDKRAVSDTLSGHGKHEKSISLSSHEQEQTQRSETAYEAMPYIDQKLKNMMTQYPPLELPKEHYSSVDTWLIKISNEGYTEKEVEKTITQIQKLTESGRKAEAAQLLLISAATHSNYAQFMLARSLFKGDILEKNLSEAFTLINRLAMDDDYPEAICDLGQLYEYGIGIRKDKKRAESLYKEAMERGIRRAQKHYERLHKENRSLFSLFRR
jgi:hypothetical protein